MTHYQYGAGGNLIAETDGATGAVQAEYVWFGGMPLAYITGGTVYAIHADHLGSPQRLTAADGTVAWDASYSPFGEATVTGLLTFNLRFPGQYLDAETGLHYNGFRDYDPTTGRYVQSDPIGLSGGWNTYGYVGGNPVMRVDPRGLCKVKVGYRNMKDTPGSNFHSFIVVEGDYWPYRHYGAYAEKRGYRPSGSAISMISELIAPGADESGLGPWGKLYARAGPYNHLAGADYSDGPFIFVTVIDNNCPCDEYEKKLNTLVSRVNSANISYNSLYRNSNAFVGTALSKIGASFPESGVIPNAPGMNARI